MFQVTVSYEEGKAARGGCLGGRGPQNHLGMNRELCLFES